MSEGDVGNTVQSISLMALLRTLDHFKEKPSRFNLYH